MDLHSHLNSEGARGAEVKAAMRTSSGPLKPPRNASDTIESTPLIDTLPDILARIVNRAFYCPRAAQPIDSNGSVSLRHALGLRESCEMRASCGNCAG